MTARDPAALPPLTFDAGGAAGVSAAAPALVGVSAARCLLETGVVGVEGVLGDAALRTLRGHAARILRFLTGGWRIGGSTFVLKTLRFRSPASRRAIVGGSTSI